MSNSTTDGLGFEEVNQNVTSTAVISGGKIYAQSWLECAGSVYATGYIWANADVYTKGRRASPVGIGSPTSGWGCAVQAGSNVTSAGSLVWTAFATAFAGIPIVSVTPLEQTAAIGVGSISTGSFVTYSVGAAKPFNYLAIGSL